MQSKTQSPNLVASCLSELHDPQLGARVTGIELLKCSTPSSSLGTSSLHASAYVVRHGSSYLLEQTRSDKASGIGLVQLPGLSENVTLDLARVRATTLLHTVPQLQTLLSIGHNAIGIPGARDADRREAVVQERLALLQNVLPRNQKQLLLGCSMGAIILGDIAYENLHSPEPLAIAGQVLFAPAIRRVGTLDPRFIQAFTRQMVADGAREFASGGMEEKLSKIGSIGQWATDSMRNLRHITHQALHLLGSTSVEHLEEAIEVYPTLVVVGEKDKVADHELWDELAKRHPSNLRVVTIPRHGHELMLHPHHAAAKLAKEILRFNQIALNLD